jgi:hypothetical protein
VLLCAAAVIAAGCHHNSNNSGYGVAWVSLTDTPGDVTSYIVNVDSVTLTGKVNGVVTAVGAVETVDFTKLNNISELWSAATVPNDEYTSATITLDYTSANISVLWSSRRPMQRPTPYGLPSISILPRRVTWIFRGPRLS